MALWTFKERTIQQLQGKLEHAIYEAKSAFYNRKTSWIPKYFIFWQRMFWNMQKNELANGIFKVMQCDWLYSAQKRRYDVRTKTTISFSSISLPTFITDELASSPILKQSKVQNRVAKNIIRITGLQSYRKEVLNLMLKAIIELHRDDLIAAKCI